MEIYKTDWKENDIVKPGDLNRIEENIKNAEINIASSFRSYAGVIGSGAEWNSYRESGSFKVQLATMSAALHAPEGAHNCGVLNVYRAEKDTGEGRTVQEYIPLAENGQKVYRIYNSSTWNPWVWLSIDGHSHTADKVNVTDTNNHFTATKLDGVLEEIYTKATTTEGRLDNKIGSLSSLQTTNKNNVVAAVNECFTNANNGKSAIAAAIGSPATASNTFTELANEIKEEKKLVALAAGMNGVETNLREQATTISTYTHSHLPNVITTNGGALVTGSGTGVTPASSTLDTIYHSINNLAGVKNTQINNITGERDTWYNNYVAMEADRNNWMNLANNRKSVQQMYPHPPALQMEKRDFATATINNYAILAGGTRGNIGLGTVDVYTDTLTLTSAQELPDPTAYFAGVSNFGGYALFAGGYRGNVILANQSNAYNSALVRVDVATLSIKRGRLGAAKTQNYALFLGGYVEGKQAVDGYTTALVRFNIANFTGYMPYSNRGKTFGGYALFNGGTRMVIAYTDACTQITMAETTSASCEALGTVGGCVLFASLNGTMDVYNANLVKTTTIQQINTRLDVAIELGNNCMFFGGAKAQTSVPRVHGESYTGTLVQTIIPCGALNDTYYIDDGANIGNYGLLFTTASKTVGDETTYTPVTAGYKIS